MADSADDLLGGYATSTLTKEEQKQLFAAALENQELFDRLVDEDALREAFDDSNTRASVLSALKESPRRSFLWSLVSLQAGAVAAVMLTAGLGVIVYRQYNSLPAPSEPQSGAVAVSTPPTPGSRQAGVVPSRLETWLESAPAAASDSVFRPVFSATPSDVSPKGVTKSRADVLTGTVFVADRAGQMAIFTVSDSGGIERVSDWQPVDVGDSQSLPASVPSAVREVRVVIVDRDVTTGTDADVIAALDAGRGAVYALQLPPD